MKFSPSLLRGTLIKRYKRFFADVELEDGTIVRVKVDLDRVGLATNYKNPDGTSHYAVNTSVKVFVIPQDRKFTLSKNQVNAKSTKPPDHMIT